MNEKRDHIFILVYHISFVAHRKNQLYPVFSEVSVTQLTFLLGISTQINLQTVGELVNYKALANKKSLMALLNLFKDWVFLIEPRRSFHNLGAAAWKDRSPSVVSVLPLQGARSKPSLERKSYLPVSLTEISSLM